MKEIRGLFYDLFNKQDKISTLKLGFLQLITLGWLTDKRAWPLGQWQESHILNSIAFTVEQVVFLWNSTNDIWTNLEIDCTSRNKKEIPKHWMRQTSTTTWVFMKCTRLKFELWGGKPFSKAQNYTYFD